MLVVVAGILWNLMSPSSAGGGIAFVIEDSSITFPTIAVRFPTSGLFGTALFACGYWACTRHKLSVARCGVAAMRAYVIASLPAMVLGLLIGFDIVGFRVAQPDHTAHLTHGLQFTYVTSSERTPSAWMLVVYPLLGSPGAWLDGMFGAWLGLTLGRRGRALEKNVKA